jgi:hydrogenase maturation protease
VEVGRPLVVCYGNPLRGDDGVGWRVADRLMADRRLAGVDVIRCHQLTPELAEDMSRAARVVLVDARLATTPGSVETLPVEPGPAGAWSHALSPPAVVALAAELYGRVPPVSVVNVGADSFDAGEGLSPAVEAALRAATDAVLRALTAPGDC